MKNLKQQLPPLNSVVTFEAAARLLSFTGAAKELNVTQAAVSRQIKTLETALDQALFIRFNRRLTLTDAGKQLLPDVQHALQLLINSCTALNEKSEKISVSIASTIAFSELKLNEWLAEFKYLNPEITVDLLATDSDINIEKDRVDLTIGCGDYAKNSQLQTTFLFSDEVFPVCSPSYLKNQPTLEKTEDLLKHSLLHLDAEHWRKLSWQAIDWQVWFKSQGIQVHSKLRGLSINNYPLLLQSVINGNGIALGWRHLVSDMLHNGDLVRPVDASFKSQRGYYLVEMSDEQSEQAKRLKEWIIACAKQEN